MWTFNNEFTISNEELREEILSSDSNNTVYILDGPTRCGKTCFLKSLPQEMTVITGFHLLCEELVHSLHKSTEEYLVCQRQMVSKYRKMGTILCFEDIDISLTGRSVTQEELGRIIRNMSEERVVVLTGIEIEERCSAFIKMLPFIRYYKWCEN